MVYLYIPIVICHRYWWMISLISIGKFEFLSDHISFRIIVIQAFYNIFWWPNFYRIHFALSFVIDIHIIPNGSINSIGNFEFLSDGNFYRIYVIPINTYTFCNRISIGYILINIHHRWQNGFINFYRQHRISIG